MPADLPQNPDFEQLRRRAKELIRAFRNGDPAAAQRVNAQLPRLAGSGAAVRLSHGQAVIARELGFRSWPRLKAHIDALQLRIEALGPTPVVDTSPAGMREFRGRTKREIAAAWFELAGRLDLDELSRALAVGRRKAVAVRDVMLNTGTLTTLVDALLVGVRHHNPSVRYICAHAMDMFADERCTGALAKLMDDPVPRVRRIAVHSLGCDDCKVTPLQAMGTGVNSPFGRDVVARVVEMALSDPSIQVRRHAAYALALFDDLRATQAIETLLVRETDEATRRGALAALRSVRACSG